MFIHKLLQFASFHLIKSDFFTPLHQNVKLIDLDFGNVEDKNRQNLIKIKH